MGMSTVRRSTSTNIMASGRQSLAPNQLFGSQTPASGSVQRRSSIYSRPSAQGVGNSHQSFFNQPAPSANAKDQRPLRDPSYRARIGQEIAEYLSQNGFELETKCVLRPESLKSPSQKEFTNIFQWLYKRIDPGYRFLKGADTEVPPILKQLRYPYAWQITKSQLSAPGSQSSWPIFLGLLHWMLQLAEMLENFTRGAYDDACAEAGVDVSGDRVVFRFLFGAYSDWLSVGNDEDDAAADAALVPHIQAMAEEFERVNAKHADELKMYEAENQALKEQVDELEKAMPDIAKLDNVFKILEDDTKKFDDYNTNVAAKIEKYDSRIKILEKEIENTVAELAAAEEERGSLQQQVDDQGLSLQDIDRMNTERERLTKSHDDAVHALEEAGKKVLAKEIETAQKLEDLESIIKRYNSLGYQLSLIPSTAANAHGQDYELGLNLPPTSTTFTTSQSGRSSRKPSPSREVDRLLASSNPPSGHSPAHLINLDLRGTVRSTLLNLRKTINERRKHAADVDLSQREMLETVADEVAEKNNEIDNLNYRLREASSLYSSLKETGATQQTQQTGAIERLEAELGRMREGVSKGVVEVEQRELEAQLAWEAMQDEAGQLRGRLHAEVEKLLEDIVGFKVHVQRGLVEFENVVGEEVEGELAEGEGLEEVGVERDGDGDVFG
jgi:kinetochore protein NDC80